MHINRGIEESGDRLRDNKTTLLIADVQIIKHHHGILGGRFVELKTTNEIDFTM
ncbi:hypothetical protein [Anaeromicrobium sediminis]|uniref:hypothetical protein n=1 Tax=Anaeromicrobium sediminis TaxID=1478221 RepID=UPI001595815D|nr:hypothetical protein [Anaeromicrobium sediminis]